MKNILLFFLFTGLLIGCKDKKAALGEDEITINDFIDLFPDTKLPYQMADSTVDKKQPDTSVVTYKMFARFVPDTVLSGQFGKKTKPRIYPLGKAVVKKAETYLFVKAITSAKKAAYILVFDKDKKFVTSKPLVISDNNPDISQTADIDTRYTITTMRKRKAGNEMLYQKNAYVYGDSVFTLILTESNDMSKVENTVYNPIDTLPRKNKYSGDYVIDARNYVSIRDGKTPRSVLFFVHFEKDKGTCNGELKGEAVFSGPTKAVFHQSSGPCVVEFSFAGSRISIKETGACGTFRDIKCFFEGSFVKKKVPKPKKPAKK